MALRRDGVLCMREVETAAVKAFKRGLWAELSTIVKFPLPA